MLGTLAVMLLGSAMAASASAEAGPFWYHRAPQTEGSGLKIAANAPENFTGVGGEQTLKGTAAGTEFEIFSTSLQVKGTASNTINQGQLKLELVYNQPRLLKPVLTNCNVLVGAKNIVQVKGHLMWKWNGTPGQLTEQPQANQTVDIGFTALEPHAQGAGTQLLTGGTFTTITLFGAGCGLLAGTYNVSGSEVGIPSPNALGSWSRTLSVNTVDHKQGTGRWLQHYWDSQANAFVPAELGLSVGGGSPAALVGQTKVTSAQQEVAVFEK